MSHRHRRLGARSVVGVDLSPRSLTNARDIAGHAGHADIEYVEADTYSAPTALGGRTFDLVYTGIGALCWLPSVERWARTVAMLLRPGGRIFLREGHPMLLAMGDHPGTARRTLAEGEFTATVTHEWSHGLGEVVTALIGAGLRIDALVEHESVPWNALPGQMTCDERGEWTLREHPERLAATYTVQAAKVPTSG